MKKRYFIQSISQSISINQNNIFSSIPHTMISYIFTTAFHAAGIFGDDTTN